MNADALAAALAAADAPACVAALDALAAAGGPLAPPLVDVLLDCLGSPSKTVQRRTADVLVRGADAAVVARLRAACATRDVRRGFGAAFTLGRLGLLEPVIVPPLLDALGHADGDKRWAAAALLVGCGRAHADVVLPALARASAAGGPATRKMVLYVLRDLAPGTPAATAALLAGLDDADVGVRHAALSGLARLGALPPEVVPRVLRIAGDDADAGLRRAATSTLGHVGRGVAGVREVLEAACASDDAGIRRAALTALRRLARDAPPSA